MAPDAPAVYRRRRAVVIALVAAALLLLIRAVKGDDSRFGGLPRTPEEARQQLLAEDPAELTISASGDLLIHSPVFARALALGGGSRYDFAPLLREVKPYIEDADLGLCHVETPMTPAPPQGYPVFNTPPDLARGIKKTGWDACDTASNHSLDQGQEGIDQTARALDRAGIAHTGSFGSAAAQRQPLILESEGVKVALLAYTGDTNGIPLPERWSVNLIRPERIVVDARAAREAGADAVIVNLHWGIEAVPEYQPEPSREQERVVRTLAAAPEITAIVGQGPHAVQPIERVGGKFVVYGEGNLLSNQSPAAGLPASSQDGLIALLDLVIDGDGARVERVRYVPVWVRQPDFVVLPVGDALEDGAADAATLRDSYVRTVDVAGRGPGIEPVPRRLASGR